MPPRRTQTKGGGEQLIGQLGARIVPRQKSSRNMQSFGKIFDNRIQVLHFAKIHLATQLEHRKLPQPGKDQCLPLVVHEV